MHAAFSVTAKVLVFVAMAAFAIAFAAIPAKTEIDTGLPKPLLGLSFGNPVTFACSTAADCLRLKDGSCPLFDCVDSICACAS